MVNNKLGELQLVTNLNLAYSGTTTLEEVKIDSKGSVYEKPIQNLIHTYGKYTQLMDVLELVEMNAKITEDSYNYRVNLISSKWFYKFQREMSSLEISSFRRQCREQNVKIVDVINKMNSAKDKEVC